MFEGANWFYKISYFISSMLPAYILFSLRLLIDLKFGTKVIFGINIPWFLLAVLAVGILFSVFIIKIIKKANDSDENSRLIDVDHHSIIEKNGDVVPFFAGVIFPLIFFFENSVLASIFSFLGIQIIMFILVSKTSSIFPNIILLIFGYNVYHFSNNIYLLSNHKQNEFHNLKTMKAERLGDNSNLYCYLKNKGA